MTRNGCGETRLKRNALDGFPDDVVSRQSKFHLPASTARKETGKASPMALRFLPQSSRSRAHHFGEGFDTRCPARRWAATNPVLILHLMAGRSAASAGAR